MKTWYLFFPCLFFMMFVAAAETQTASGKTPEASTDVGKSAKWDAIQHQGRTGDYLLGKVTFVGLPAGSLPWDPVPINVTCSGKIQYTTNADPKGDFEIVAAQTDVKSRPLGTDGSKPVSEFIGCAVEATLSGFTSSTLTVVDRNILDNPDIGTIQLTREQGASGAAISGTTSSAPKDATKAFERARAEWLEQKPDKAQHDLEKAVQVYPQFAEAWYQLGRMQEASHSQDAQNSFAKAAAADPKFILPYAHLVIYAAQSGKWQDVADDTGHELELDPRGSAQIWYFNALANYKLNKKDAAEASATKASAMDPLHTQPNTEQLLAVILADKRDFAGALMHLRNCLTYLPSGPNADMVKQQIAQLEKMAPDAK